MAASSSRGKITKIADGFAGGGTNSIERSNNLAHIWAGYDLKTRTLNIKPASKSPMPRK